MLTWYIQVLVKRRYAMQTVTKKELFMWQAPSFNFDLNADEILAKALEVGFVTEVSEDQYVVNDNYVSKYDRVK